LKRSWTWIKKKSSWAKEISLKRSSNPNRKYLSLRTWETSKKDWLRNESKYVNENRKRLSHGNKVSNEKRGWDVKAWANSSIWKNET